MCDTLWRQWDNFSVFAKNSDRSCNEPNLVLYAEGGKTSEKTVKCTYIEVSQVDYVYKTLLLKPSWMWGAEAGINEKGVVIGNEAVFTKSKGKRTPRLTGMDMLRLALERADDAKAAVDIIKDLLTTYGQGGNCGFDKKFHYDNSFLIADGTRAFVLETSGRDWALKKLHIFGNISNRLSLTNDYSNCSFDKELDFSRECTAPLFTHFSGSKERSDDCANYASRAETLFDIFRALKSHEELADDDKLFNKGSVKSVCMHQSLVGDHTTGSFVAALTDEPCIWVTGCSTPCMSAFKPLFMHNPLPQFTDEKQAYEYWLKREYLNRAVMSGLVDADEHRLKVQCLENGFVAEYRELVANNADLDTLSAFSVKCFAEEEAFIDDYAEIIEGVKNGRLALSRRWAKKTKDLGKGVFK